MGSVDYDRWERRRMEEDAWETGDERGGEGRETMRMTSFGEGGKRRERERETHERIRSRSDQIGSDRSDDPLEIVDLYSSSRHLSLLILFCFACVVSAAPGTQPTRRSALFLTRGS